MIFVESLDKRTKITICNLGKTNTVLLRIANKNDIAINIGNNNSLVFCLGESMPFTDKVIEAIIFTEEINKVTLKYITERYIFSTAYSLEQSIDSDSANLIEKQKIKFLKENDSLQINSLINVQVISNLLGKNKSSVIKISQGNYTALVINSLTNEVLDELKGADHKENITDVIVLTKLNNTFLIGRLVSLFENSRIILNEDTENLQFKNIIQVNKKQGTLIFRIN